MSDRQMSEDEFRKMVLDGLRTITELLKDYLSSKAAVAERQEEHRRILLEQAAAAATPVQADQTC